MFAGQRCETQEHPLMTHAQVWTKWCPQSWLKNSLPKGESDANSPN